MVRRPRRAPGQRLSRPRGGAPHRAVFGITRRPGNRRPRTSRIALHLDFLFQTLRIAEDRRERGSAMLVTLDEPDRHVPLLRTSIHVRARRPLSVSDIVDRNIVMRAPEERHLIETL